MRKSHIWTGLAFVGVCIVIGMGLAYVSMAHKNAPTDGASATASPSPVGATNLPADPTAAATAAPDFLVTEQLRANQPTFENVGQGPTTHSFCEGARAVIANGTSRLLNLDSEPDASDNAAPIGTLKPGESLTFDTGEVGTWNILDAEDEQPLFQYEVKDCTSKAAAHIAIADDVSTRAAAVPGQAPAGPSFDCSKATSNVLQIICGNQELSALDVQLTNLYKQTLARSSYDGLAARQNLVQSERHWIADRLRCPDAQCIETSYRTRIAELEAAQ